MTDATKRAIKKHGKDICIKAYELCELEGNGASTIAEYLELANTNQADSVINAGREIVESA
jgi:hypothetical protein